MTLVFYELAVAFVPGVHKQLNEYEWSLVCWVIAKMLGDRATNDGMWDRHRESYAAWCAELAREIREAEAK